MFPTASISGTASGGDYSQTLSVGNFYVVLLLEGLTSDEEMEMGHNLLGRIEESVEQNSTITALELVEMFGQESDGQQAKVSLLVVKIEGQRLWAAGIGKIEIKLVRQGKVVHLLGQSSEVKNVSGPLQHGDFIFLGTTALVSQMALAELVNLPKHNLEDIKEKWGPLLESGEQGAAMAGTFIQINLTQGPLRTQEVPVSPIEVAEQEEVSTPPAMDMVPKVNSPNMPSEGVKESFFSQMRAKKEWLPKVFHPDNPSSRKSLYLAVLVLVIFASLISFQLRSRNLETNSKNLQAIEKSADEGIASASKLEGLNDQIARQTLLQTRNDIETQIENLYGADWKTKNLPDKEKLNQVIAKIDHEVEKVSHVYAVSPQVFYDFSLMKSGPKIVAANLHGSEIVAVDGANGAIYSLMTKNKEATLVVGNNDLKYAKFIDFTPETMYVYLPSGIFAKKLDGSDQFKQVAKIFDKFGDIKAMNTFGGNLYVLDPTNNQVWKYQGTDLGFAEPVRYLLDGLSTNISGGTSMMIDGFVYVLIPSEQGQAAWGHIAKFSGGDTSEFGVTGLPDAFSQPRSIFVSDETQNVYVWDAANKIVYVLDKKGGYQAEYKIGDGGSDLGASTKIFVDESVKKIFLLTDSKVYQTEIKN